MKGTAALLRERGGPLHVSEVTFDDLRDDEVFVRIAGVGVCHTDLAAIAGTPPLPRPAVLGHEGAGTVEQVGPAVTALEVGDRVVLSFDSCRTCGRCHAGRPAYCEHFGALNASGVRRDGTSTLKDGAHGSFCGQSSFATHSVASVRNAVRVPDDVQAPLELLGPFGCSLQTGAGAVLEVLKPQPGTSIAIFGAGAVGLAAVMAARVAGCDPIVVVEPDEHRRALAVEHGATRATEPGGERIRGMDFALEAVGAPEVIGAALKTLASPGTCVTLGFRGSPNPVTLDQGHLLYGRTLTGVIEGDVDPHVFIPQLIDLHAAGEFPLEKLVTTFPLADVNAAIQSSAIKPVLIP